MGSLVRETPFFKSDSGSIGTDSSGSLNLLDTVPLNGSGDPLVVTIPCGDISFVDTVNDFVRVAATAVVITPTADQRGGGLVGALDDSADGSAAAITPLVRTRTSSVSEVFYARFDVRGKNSLTLTYAGTAAGATDFITVQAMGVAGE